MGNKTPEVGGVRISRVDVVSTTKYGKDCAKLGRISTCGNDVMSIADDVVLAMEWPLLAEMVSISGEGGTSIDVGISSGDSICTDVCRNTTSSTEAVSISSTADDGVM